LDAIVVGGGIAGVSIAYELADFGSVLLLEAESQLAQHTTGRSAAMYLPSYGGAVVRALTAASLPDFERVQADVDDVMLLSPRALLWVVDAAGLPALEGTVAHSGETLRRLTPEDGRRLCPALRPETLAGCAVDESGMDIDVLALHQWYVRGFRERGGTLATSSAVTRLDPDGAGWRVATGESERSCDVVVNAAGAWGDTVAVLAGVAPVGLRPLRRTLFTSPHHWTDPIDGWPLVADAEERFYFKPEGEQLLVSPADETPSEPCDARAEEIDIARALEVIDERTTLGLRHVRSSWAGLRTFAPDRGPVAGPPDSAPGFCWFAGQGGYGIQMAPALARLGAALALGDAIPPDIAALGVTAAAVSPDRFV
jgi:D-arginine dehydrogenase